MVRSFLKLDGRAKVCLKLCPLKRHVVLFPSYEDIHGLVFLVGIGCIFGWHCRASVRRRKHLPLRTPFSNSERERFKVLV